MNVKYIDYTEKYLDQIIELWNEEMIYDQISKKKFSSFILEDPNFDANLCILAFDEDNLIGFGYGVKRKVPYQERGLEPKRGWINIVFTKKEYRHNKIATTIVKELEKRLKTMGAEEITLCAYSPNYFTPGIDQRYIDGIKFFESLGYVYKNIGLSMQRCLLDHALTEETKDIIKKLKAEGIEFVHYSSEYATKLLEWALKNFGAGWKNNINNAIKNNEAEEVIIMVLKDKEPIGFCMRQIDGNPDRFGPIGVNEEFRSKGLGGVLIEIMMNDMVKHDVHNMYFLWTLEAKDFYERHGLHIYRTYNLYRKEI